ncbi:uncharacterized protein LOC106155115 [Lingula anatina]|uniref:Uncharacterized protein LOC106155115 n=1 Tax=Lingula anatina TaxID=7574 RepID=A0A1S3HJR6_LINAN|nr:uncharacterized protein LOC106155115 [Lingula anatina]|eukprot:XP_013385234.1 uncharacterized protein LOC106155115 [Lingula anatina]
MNKIQLMIGLGAVMVMCGMTNVDGQPGRGRTKAPAWLERLDTRQQNARRMFKEKVNNRTFNTTEGSLRASRWGNFTISKSKKNIDNDRNSTTFSVCQMAEKTRSNRGLGRKLGWELGRRGGPSANFNSTMQMMYNMSQPEPTVYGGLKAWAFDMETSLPSGANITVSVYRFNETGNFTDEDGVVTPITRGDVKFNMELSGFELCNGNDTACNDTTEFLDVDFCVGSREEPKARRGSPKNAVGRVKDIVLGKSNITMEDKAYIDGAKHAMAEGYPKIVRVGNKWAIRVRFPRFNSTVLYDPIISQGEADEVASLISGGRQVALSSILVCLCAAFLSSAMFLMKW